MKLQTHKRRILLTKDAAEAFRLFQNEAGACAKRGDLSGPQLFRFHAAEQFIQDTETGDPFVPEHGLSGPLSKIFVAISGPLRIYYTGMQGTDAVLILYFSEKTSSDEAYSVLSKMAGSAKFDTIFQELGLSPPDRSKELDPPPIH
jgi:hypothetical protein